MAGGFHRRDTFREYKPRHAAGVWRQFWSFGKPKPHAGRHRNDSGVSRSHGDRFGDWS